MTTNYSHFLRELSKVSAYAPRGKAPKLYNYHQYIPHPFAQQPSPTSAAATATSVKALMQTPLRLRSERYARSGRYGPGVVLKVAETHTPEGETDGEAAVGGGASTAESDAVGPSSAPQSTEQVLTASIPNVPRTAEYLTDIPLPAVLTRHIHMPSPTLQNGNAVGKITGFRIEVTGRRGNRSATQRYGYGRLGSGSVADSYVDFAKSLLVNKKGSTGVKVWIGYGR
ncbi:uncharacterized protein EV422DRAFT_506249 [Fimicolochytrium jonesii]|uniref:uncharacterized protein n=1 Tax=Fimicolochytrium jonesii TaxID=1396493 RepID=UPI0022FEDA53|nr:uncharacterized protein EV422DRAFT_506249 [Fimicolochytrium jonesii]KAI8821029.1 hypothetical protein EV422DRAFT_506249 [Fimicolochytrium jonesii]